MRPGSGWSTLLGLVRHYGGIAVPLYVALLNWTEQGSRTIKDSVKRSEAANAAAEKMNCKVRTILWTMGPYDVITIVEAPNDQVASAFALATGMQGNVRTLTMRAYEKEEFARILGGLP